MQVNVLLFAAASEAAKSDSICVELAQDASAGDLLAEIGRQLPQLASLLPACRIAVDCCYVDSDAPVDAKSEIALIPPVSGG